MASAKARRYGQGGMKHKRVTEPGRPSGKSYKKYPKKFDADKRRLVTA